MKNQIKQLTELIINKSHSKRFVIKFNIVVFIVLTTAITIHSINYNRATAVQQIKLNKAN